MRHQPRLMFHLAFPRGEPSVANSILSVCTLNGNILSLGRGHNVYVSRLSLARFMSSIHVLQVSICDLISRLPHHHASWSNVVHQGSI